MSSNKNGKRNTRRKKKLESEKNLWWKSIKSFPDDWMFISLNNDTAATPPHDSFAVMWRWNAPRERRLILLRVKLCCHCMVLWMREFFFYPISSIQISRKKERKRIEWNGMKYVNRKIKHFFVVFSCLIQLDVVWWCFIDFYFIPCLCMTLCITLLCLTVSCYREGPCHIMMKPHQYRHSLTNKIIITISTITTTIIIIIDKYTA